MIDLHRNFKTGYFVRIGFTLTGSVGKHIPKPMKSDSDSATASISDADADLGHGGWIGSSL